MEFVHVRMNDGIAEIKLKRGKVNALNEQVVDEVADCLKGVADDPGIRAVILTAEGPFFSFGFDIPEFLSYSKESFSEFLRRFAALYRHLFTFPKPVVAALNGHAIAGACMLALTCDYRVMVSGKAKISLNEITFGSSVFAGSVAMLQALVGSKNAQAILYQGTMYSAHEAAGIGLVDQVSSGDKLVEDARDVARRLSTKDAAAYRSIKNLLRAPVIYEMRTREEKSIQEFVDIWYSDNTRRNLQDIKIRS